MPPTQQVASSCCPSRLVAVCLARAGGHVSSSEPQLPQAQVAALPAPQPLHSLPSRAPTRRARGVLCPRAPRSSPDRDARCQGHGVSRRNRGPFFFVVLDGCADFRRRGGWQRVLRWGCIAGSIDVRFRTEQYGQQQLEERWRRRDGQDPAQRAARHCAEAAQFLARRHRDAASGARGPAGTRGVRRDNKQDELR